MRLATLDDDDGRHENSNNNGMAFFFAAVYLGAPRDVAPMSMRGRVPQHTNKQILSRILNSLLVRFDLKGDYSGASFLVNDFQEVATGITRRVPRNQMMTNS